MWLNGIPARFIGSAVSDSIAKVSESESDNIRGIENPLILEAILFFPHVKTLQEKNLDFRAT